MKTRSELGAGERDVIDHLLVDAPPCDPDEDRAVETTPRSETANALALMLRHVDGSMLLDWSERNVAAMVELGATAECMSTGPATGKMRLEIADPEHRYTHYIVCSSNEIQWVESREQARAQAGFSWCRDKYVGWDEPPPPELTAEQAEAIAAEARAQAAEYAMVEAAERERAAELAAKAFPAAAARAKEAA